MAIIRWNPLNLSSLLEDDWDLPTVPGLSRLGQGLNIYETEDALVAEASVPGIEEDEIDVTVDQGVVRIAASTSNTQEDKDKRRYFMASRTSSFNYTFRLPEGMIEGDVPQAELHNGILTLSFKKAKKAEPKKVKVVKKSTTKEGAK